MCVIFAIMEGPKGTKKNAGSGRKALGRETVCWRISPATAGKIRDAADKTGKTCGQVVDFIVAEYERLSGQL